MIRPLATMRMNRSFALYYYRFNRHLNVERNEIHKLCQLPIEPKIASCSNGYVNVRRTFLAHFSFFWCAARLTKAHKAAQCIDNGQDKQHQHALNSLANFVFMFMFVLSNSDFVSVNPSNVSLSSVHITWFTWVCRGFKTHSDASIGD